MQSATFSNENTPNIFIGSGAKRVVKQLFCQNFVNDRIHAQWFVTLLLRRLSIYSSKLNTHYNNFSLKKDSLGQISEHREMNN